MVDGQFLSRIAARFWSICAFILPFVISALSTNDETGQHLMGSNVCNLTQKEMATIEAAKTTIEAAKNTIATIVGNTSCSFNDTIANFVEG